MTSSRLFSKVSKSLVPVSGNVASFLNRDNLLRIPNGLSQARKRFETLALPSYLDKGIAFTDLMAVRLRSRRSGSFAWGMTRITALR